jgi:hypothetical protein
MDAGIAFTGSGIQLNGSIYSRKATQDNSTLGAVPQRALGPLSRDNGESTRRERMDTDPCYKGCLVHPRLYFRQGGKRARD